MNEALLIIDMQNGCRDDCRCKDEFDSAVEYINTAAGLFREKGRPVFIIQDVGVGGGPGSEAFSFVPGINRDGSDITLQKAYCNSFWKTGLEETLREMGIEFVVISGFAAEYCVIFTYNGAVERGFHVSLLQKGIAGGKAEEIDRMQLLRPVVSLQALEHMLA